MVAYKCLRGYLNSWWEVIIINGVVTCCKCIGLRRGVGVGPKSSVRKIKWTVQKSRLMEPSSGLGTELVILIRGISLWLTSLIVIIIWCLFSTSKVLKAFSFRGALPDPLYRLALAMAWPLHGYGGFYQGLGGLCPHEPRQFECCHAMKFITHTCLACPYISVNTVVSGRVSYSPPR